MALFLPVWTTFRVSLFGNHGQIELIMQIFNHLHLFDIKNALSQNNLIQNVPDLELVTIQTLIQTYFIINVVLLIELVFSMEHHEGVLEKLSCRHALFRGLFQETFNETYKFFGTTLPLRLVKVKYYAVLGGKIWILNTASHQLIKNDAYTPNVIPGAGWVFEEQFWGKEKFVNSRDLFVKIWILHIKEH